MPVGVAAVAVPLTSGCSIATDRGHYVSIQWLRAVAAMLVVVFHGFEAINERFPGHAPLHWENGSAGVDVFFVISGFVMIVSSERLLGKAGGWWLFLKHRLIRIVPLYWLVSSLKLTLLLVVPALALHTRATPGYVLRSFLFLPLHDARGVFQPLLPVGWTLTYEMLFYMLFTVALFAKIRPVIFILPFLVTLTLIPHDPRSDLGLLCDPIIIEFGLGMIVGRLCRRGVLIPSFAALILLVVASAVILAVPLHLAGGRLVTWGLPAAILVYCAAALEPWIARARLSVLALVGDASYSIYLIHGLVLPPVVLIFANLLRFVDNTALLIITECLAAMLVGITLHMLVERPLTARLKRLMPSKPR